MNCHVNAISGRLSLRKPQRQSLEILHQITELHAPGSKAPLDEVLRAVSEEFPSVTNFEREFLSVCFALATGVGKTRLMGAFIAYLHLKHHVRNFFVIAPNLTIYNKLIGDFTENSPKYVFKGISEFAVDPPAIITGDDYDEQAGTLLDQFDLCKINIFNVSKINSEVRGGKPPKIKRMQEYIGKSYFDYLAGLSDLVLLMDESHRYRASAGVRAINELKPILGLELTATPFVETNHGTAQFQNVVLDYPLGLAMEDGFVKEPAVVTRKNFDPSGMSADEIEQMKLEDGVRLHEIVKVNLETYARETNNRIVKPFVLVIARDTTHAKGLLDLIQSGRFFSGRYADKVIQVDSSQTGKREDEMIERLLKVESTEEPTEIVIHVNMLKEGWDVTNLYTIVPLRAANARILIEQSIGRGLRLPYGRRTGVTAVDRLNIIAHDKFQEVVDAAAESDSPIQMKQLVMSGEDLEDKPVTVVSRTELASQLGVAPPGATSSTLVATPTERPDVFASDEERQIAQAAYRVIRRLENAPETVPTVRALTRPDVLLRVKEEVAATLKPALENLPGVKTEVDIAAVVKKTSQLVVDQTIDMPRIMVVPTGEVTSYFVDFDLNLSSLNFQLPSEDLWIQHLRTHQRETLSIGSGGISEARLADYIVSSLIDYDYISYEDHADLLYDVAETVVNHFRSYLGSDEDVRKVLHCHQRQIVGVVQVQLSEAFRERAAGYEVKVSKGFTQLKDSVFSASAENSIRHFRKAPEDKTKISRHVYGGFKRCLYPALKFHSDTERKLAIILDRESLKWFRPAVGQFQIVYSEKGEQHEYCPDFVAETDNAVIMFEPKQTNKMDDSVVLAKRDAAVRWCRRASEYASEHGGKPWTYVLVPHVAIAENMTIAGLTERYAETSTEPLEEHASETPS